MNPETRQRIKEMVAEGPPAKTPSRPVSQEQMEEMYQKESQGSGIKAPVVLGNPVPLLVPLADELVIEITGNGGSASITLRPSEVSRLRSRFGRGPAFEKWVVDRVRDGLISFGGG